MTALEKKRRMVVVSNRLPVVIHNDEGQWHISPGSGGLVTALAPVMQANHGLWVGWPGCDADVPIDSLVEDFAGDSGYRLLPVPLTEDEVERYYRGFSNEALWPLFHDLLGHCKFDLENWRSYVDVNKRFAQVIASQVEPNDTLWIHDYQLILVGPQLRAQKVRQPLGFFLHIPFPSLDLFRRLPWKGELLRGLLEYDLIGFQTLRDRRNFVHCATSLVAGVQVEARYHQYTVLRVDGRRVKVGHFPISIDFEEFNAGAENPEVADAAWYLHENLQRRQLMLGVDRLDYTKGIPERLRAYERALEKYPEMKRNITLLQVVVPSRTLVPDYQNLKELLDRLVGRINSRFAESGWVPIHYIYRSLDRTQLLAHYRACEIALVTPLRDGMNLVAKEYCASSVDKNGVLILSEFAGAADQLGKAALLVNPYDIDGTADAIYQAFTMSYKEREHRLQSLRTQIRRNDVHRWVRQFLALLE